MKKLSWRETQTLKRCLKKENSNGNKLKMNNLVQDLRFKRSLIPNMLIKWDNLKHRYTDMVLLERMLWKNHWAFISLRWLPSVSKRKWTKMKLCRTLFNLKFKVKPLSWSISCFTILKQLSKKSKKVVNNWGMKLTDWMMLKWLKS